MSDGEVSDPPLALTGPGRVEAGPITPWVALGGSVGALLAIAIAPLLATDFRRTIGLAIGPELAIAATAVVGGSIGTLLSWLEMRRRRPAWLVFDPELVAVVVRDRVVFQSRWDQLRWRRTGWLMPHWEVFDPEGRRLNLETLGFQRHTSTLQTFVRALRRRRPEFPTPATKLSPGKAAAWIAAIGLGLYCGRQWQAPLERGEVLTVVFWVGLACVGGVLLVLGLMRFGPHLERILMTTLARWGAGGGPPPPDLPRHDRELPVGAWMQLRPPARAMPSTRSAWVVLAISAAIATPMPFVAATWRAGLEGMTLFLCLGACAAVAQVVQVSAWRRKLADFVWLDEDGALHVVSSSGARVYDWIEGLQGCSAFAELGSCYQRWRGNLGAYLLDPRYLVEVAAPALRPEEP